MRSIDSAALEALLASKGEEVMLIAITYSGGILRMTTGGRPLDWAGETWVSVGGGLTVGAIEESGDLRGEGLDLVLSGVDQSIAAILLSQEYRGRTVFVGQAILDQTTGAVTSVITWFDGLQLDNYEISENVERGKPATSTVRTRMRHRLGEDEFRGIRANVHSHQQYYPDDTFFQHVASLTNEKIYWGTAAPSQINSGSGGGTGGGDDDDNNHDGTKF